MHRDTLVRLLTEMADIVDSEGGPGGGAILLEAVAEIESLYLRLASAKAPAESRTPDPAEWR